MIEKTLEARINHYSPANAVEQDNVLQEILQQYVLASLARAGLFKVALFQGGTCLRMFHGISRFSEDLDFILKEPDRGFTWQQYLEQVGKDCSLEGIDFEVQDRSAREGAVKKAFLRTDAIGKIVSLRLPYERHATRKVKIKLEADTNPPEGSVYETRYLTFPRTVAVTCQTLESGFATKTHALLCRPYVKGRDWYDFIWYVDKGTAPQLELLGNAIEQYGPWAGQCEKVTQQWLIDCLTDRIQEVDWRAARDDVQRFLPLVDQEALQHWSPGLFLSLVERLARNMPE